MAQDLRITDLVGEMALEAMFGAAHVQANDGIIRIYADAGTPDIPAGEPALGASHGTLLAELVMAAAAFGAPAASTAYVRMTAAAIASDTSANASGDAVYFVLYDDDATDVALLQGTVGLSGASPAMTIDNVTIAAGATVSCSAFYIQVPKGWLT